MLTFHFKSGPNLWQLNVLMVGFLVGVVSAIYKVIKTKLLNLSLLKTFTTAVNTTTHLKEMKSSVFANVITRLLSSLGTGKRYFRMLDTYRENFFFCLNAITKSHHSDQSEIIKLSEAFMMLHWESVKHSLFLSISTDDKIMIMFIYLKQETEYQILCTTV